VAQIVFCGTNQLALLIIEGTGVLLRSPRMVDIHNQHKSLQHKAALAD
jgi:hypothetical protein